MTTEAVLYQQHGAFAEIILNRPEALNAMNLDLIESLFKSVQTARKNKELRCLLIRGNGRIFCAGGDIKFFASNLGTKTPIAATMPDQLHATIESLRELPFPVVASVHGSAGGAGTSLLLACDLVICSEEVKLNLAYCRIGLSPDGGSTYFLPRHVGLKKAMEIFLTSSNLSAGEALALGLINKVVPTAELEKETKTLVEKLAAGPTEAFARTKKLLNESSRNNLHAQLALETKMICDSSHTNDFKEGITAFLEKRPIQFTGR